MLPLGSIYFPLIYVLPFYVWPTQLPRNHPTTIWRRMAVSAATCLALSWVPTYLTLRAAAGPGRVSAQSLLKSPELGDYLNQCA